MEVIAIKNKCTEIIEHRHIEESVDLFNSRPDIRNISSTFSGTRVRPGVQVAMPVLHHYS